jgi:3-phytase
VRFATFNASLTRDAEGQLLRDLSAPDDTQARNVAEIIQRVRPDVLLINEFDYDAAGKSAELFQRNYLSVSQNGAEPIEYPHRVVFPSNTGVPSGHDLDNDGTVHTKPGTREYGNDSFGYGIFPGQYAFVVFSKYPIDHSSIRIWQMFLWKQMPGALLPRRDDGSDWFAAAALDVVRLSSKNHADVPVQIGRRRVSLLVSHPTPPAFDGPEHRNRRRNHDEIRLFADYISGGRRASYSVAPREVIGPDFGTNPVSPTGRPRFVVVRDRRPSTFVILGDLNADPTDGSSLPGAIQQLLDHPKVNHSFTPRSDGAVEAATIQGQKNLDHRGQPDFDTADFADSGRSPGNLRVDYVLPSRDLKIIDGGVFWPKTDDELYRLVRMNPTVASSDHRLVWLDVLVRQ